MNVTLYIIGGLAISQLAFMAFFFALYHRRHLIGRLLALYAVCLICHVLTYLPVTHINGLLAQVFYRMASLAPAILWLTSRYLFVDNATVPRWVWALVVSYLGLRTYGSLTIGNAPDFSTTYVMTYVVPQLVMLGFSGHAILMAFQGLSSDLVEPRRRVRVPFIPAMGILVAAILMNGFIRAAHTYSGVALPIVPNEFLFGYMFLITLWFNVKVMRLEGEALQVIVLPREQQPVRLSPVPTATRKTDNTAMVQRIFTVLREEKLYARPGLTIGELAQRLSMQEYRLRRVINKELGYRNFNQFLNEFRIAEVCRRLELPPEQREPIANIAFDVGYSALSSFNKAFKDIHHVTPTQYRDGAHSG